MKKAFLFLSLLLFFGEQFCYAQEETSKHPILTSKFQVGLGIYIPTQNVKFGIDADAENQEIEFDETFDFNNNNVTPQATFDWRFARMWKLGAEYFRANYNSRFVLENDIIAGDYTFESGSSVQLGYKINLYRVFVGRLISTGEHHEFGGGLGLHILDIAPYIEGNIIVNDDDNEFRRVTGSATAPLPNIALWYHYAPTEKWAVSAKVDWFGITVGEYSGSLWDVSPSVRYQLMKNLGVSLDYRFFKVSADVNKEKWDGSFDLSFSGPSFTLFGNL